MHKYNAFEACLFIYNILTGIYEIGLNLKVSCLMRNKPTPVQPQKEESF